ncbi:4-alpha-glucanotransferase [Succinatimonas hippei]|uniref:4-alpha-glucanotransferase n=1 Tax=Succinatimonas hippei TaxID=626938 RepID=UPI0026ED0A60|nr:4-alpha-glucanotransferase [Succinatimonas hippei]
MKLKFLIEYKACFKQDLYIKLLKPKAQFIPLTCHGDRYWQGTIDLNDDAFSLIEYLYVVKAKNRIIRSEALRFSHKLALNIEDNEAVVTDCWRDKLNDSFLYTDAFCSKQPLHSTKVLSGSLNLRTWCHLNKDCSLLITGNCDYLGNWDVNKGLPLTQIKRDFFTISLNKQALPDSFKFKFVALNQKTGEIFWEIGPDREISISGKTTEYPAEYEVKLYPSFPKIAGTAIPVFALKSEGSFGIGDFGDLKLFVDWAIRTGQKLVQILPINDTTMTKTWRDSYPYSSISVYALHPMFIDLRQIGKLKNTRLNTKFKKLQKKLNALGKIDYEEVNNAKIEYLRHAYADNGAEILNSADFSAFFNHNKSWLIPYAAFCFFREKYGTADFRQWEQYSVYDCNEITALCQKNAQNYHDIAFYFYLQYLLHTQLCAVSSYAKEHGIILKGDIPIGVSRNSVETWSEPFYFNMESQAGAPPDPFAKDGQNWSFPTYNWERMEQDGYSWWLKRFNKMSEYFGAYRIDHILGFFRIWDIPTHAVRGLLGNFTPSLPLSVAEIESYGIKFQYDFMTRPFINEDLLNRLFGQYVNEVKKKFVRNLHHDIYGLNDDFVTEKQVEAYFNGKTDEKSIKLRDGLYALISDVLFIPDRNYPNRYHPRIAVLDDYIFSRLQPFEKEAFTRLYNDYFYRRHNDFWYREAMKKLPMLVNSTTMLTCGEDLGMVPDCVPWVMRNLDILSLEIERMPKDPGCLFNNPEKYPTLSVATTGTHDMSTIRSWWEEDPMLTQTYFNNVLRHEGKAPKVISGALCEEIILRQLQSPSLLCVLPLQDFLSIDEKIRFENAQEERINVPAIPHYYWRYRMHITLEELLSNQKFNDKIAALISASGRN